MDHREHSCRVGVSFRYRSQPVYQYRDGKDDKRSKPSCLNDKTVPPMVTGSQTYLKLSSTTW